MIGESPPLYPLTNIQIKGYDFGLVESFQDFIHDFVENCGIDVKEKWSVQAQTVKVETYATGGTEIKDTYNLAIYERNVQLLNLRSVDMPLILDALRTATPPGVTVDIHPHSEMIQENRYIEDPFISMLKKEIKDIDEKVEMEKSEAADKKLAKDEAKRNYSAVNYVFLLFELS